MLWGVWPTNRPLSGGFFRRYTVARDLQQTKNRINGVKAPLSPVFEDKYLKLPGLIDVHVHLREPGFSYKETILSGTMAAAAGGYAAVCCMPNLSPVPDSLENLKPLEDIISRDARVKVYPYASITLGERGETLTDFHALKKRVVAFSDDGRGVQSEDAMRRAMQLAAREDVIIAAHCEDDKLRAGGYINAGKYAAGHSHKGISSESEWRQIERDLKLAAETGAKYHVCHISTKESVRLIRDAKARGVDVTCETAPHYLVLDENDMREDGRFKMNPPLRAQEDRLALLEGVKDGTIDIIATDHAPHSVEEKAKGLENSAMGVVGLECAFPILYTELVKKGVISLDRLLEMMCYAPSRRFGIPVEGTGYWDIETEYEIDPAKFLSKGRSTPFEGRKVVGKCVKLELGGKTVWDLTER